MIPPTQDVIFVSKAASFFFLECHFLMAPGNPEIRASVPLLAAFGQLYVFSLFMSIDLRCVRRSLALFLSLSLSLSLSLYILSLIHI